VKSRSGWLLLAISVLICALLGFVAAGYGGRGPLSTLGVTVTELQPQAVRLLGEGGDPLVILIGVHWTKDGWCSGQFTVQATEYPTEIRVSNVTSREYHFGDCADLGTAEGMAWADVHLSAPLGERAVVRDSDGTRLPVSVF
jgi:hypothetical protein